MSDFVSTVDLLGDDVVMDAIIDGSITEYKDNSITTIGTSAFSGCKQLITVDCPEVTSASNFNGCTALSSINLPKLSSFVNYMFNGCTSLTSVSFPQAAGGANRVFLDCTALVSADLPMVTSLGIQYFCNCGNLKEVNIPRVVTIDANAFSGHSGPAPIVEKLDLVSCTTINSSGFPKWPSTLHTLILRADTVCNLQISGLLDNTAINSGAGYIYVPKTMADGTDGIVAYEAATNWSAYAGRFRYIEDYTVDGTLMGEIDESKI